MLNTLKGSQDIEAEFKDLVSEYPECIKAIPLLLAVRENVIAITENDRRLDFNFNNMNYDIELYVEFMNKTGIFDLLQSHVIGDLLDVGLGINIGLDSNARKNRGGDQMEDLVEFFIKEAGFEKDVTYFKEMYLHEVEQKWGYNLSSISADGVASVNVIAIHQGVLNLTKQHVVLKLFLLRHKMLSMFILFGLQTEQAG